MEQREQRTPAQTNFASRSGPFSLMRRMSEDIDRMFGEFFGMEPFSSRAGSLTRWPQIEVSHRGGKLVVRADLPGLEKDDVNVEVRDDELCISGERRAQSEQKGEGGYYRTERSYGSFHRTVPLPQGAKAETASATFDKGVLEVELEVPEQTSQRRKLEVRSHSSSH